LAAAQVLAQSLWWFHPLVWLANRLLSREAERCCDEQVLAELGCEPARYARSLLDILQLKHELLAVPAFPGVRPVDVTSNRLERIMRLGHGCQRRTPWWCWLVMLLAAAIVLPGAAFVAGAKERPGKLKQIGWKQSAAAATQATPATPAEGTGERVTRVYPARDLLARLMEELRVDEAQAREDLRGHVIGLAQLQDPQLAWEGKKLVATHSAAQHERVAAALAQLREFGVRQITLSVRMVSGPPALLERFPIRWSAADTALAEPGVRPTSQVFAALDFEPLPLPAEAKPGESWTQAASVIEKNMPVLYAVLTAEQARPLIETAQGDSRANILQSPKVTVFNGQRATVMDATQRPFVVGVKPVASDDPSAPPAFEPQIRVVSEGTTLRMRPVLQARDQLRLDYEFTLASVRSVETAKIPQGKGAEPLTVQVPEVASVRFCSSLQMPLGRTLAVGVLTKQGAKPGAMVVLLEVNDIKPAGDHQAAPVAAKDSPTLPAPRAVAGASHLTAAEAALEERLQRKIFAAHGRMTLDQAIEAISKAAGINILIDQRGLAAEGVTLDTPVQVQRQGVAVAAGTLLRQLLEPLEMAFVIENECLRVTGASELRKPFTKVYLVADLIAAVPQIVGVVDGKPLPPPAVAKADFDPLIQLITTTIAPQSWDSTGGPGSLSAFETNMSLVVSQSQEVHEQIADTLQQLRRLRDQQVVLELQLLCVEKTFFERLGLDLVIEPADDKASIARARLTAQQAASLLRAVGPAPRGSSRLTLLNGQAGDLDLPLGGKERKVNLKLVPRIRFDARSILLELAVGSEEGEDAAAKSVDLICDAGQVLLLDVTDRIPAAGVPMLTKLPHVGPLFKQTPPAGSRVLLLVTPEIHFGEEVVVGEASRAAATHAAASAKQH
ncbi:MAG TPA: M56 family metallopeptidase, partial [Pirellulaceae bacterium]|nr:M56 family metallopeptidase [Pirellulaceae bacterium]